ncbi:MAG: XTP/dITP diphosphatase [Chitinivibrionales bacterium]|nr:XTP/dITP diphosphatase [Chitinivibrionales bacterium]
MHTLIVATGNRGKLKEITEMLSDFDVAVQSLADIFDPVPAIPETGATFLANARRKADWVYSRKGLWTLADDSGLEVDSLEGAPGVRSARYAGEPADDVANNAKLLEAISACPVDQRAARFRCVMVVKLSDTSELVAEGTCEGRIAQKPSGSGGFGYDPLFVPAGYDRSFAELEAGEKNRISHRGNALRQLRSKLAAWLDA